MGKKYLETKNKSLESSILGVWKTAVEEGAGRMDGRTAEYRNHRKKLESARQRRESKRVTKEDVELDKILEMSDEEFDSLLNESDEMKLEGIVGSLKKVGGAAKKVGQRFSAAGRADAAEKKLKKAQDKQKNVKRRKDAKAQLKALKKGKPAKKEELVNPKDREDLGTEPSDTAKKQKKATEPTPNQMTEAQSGDKEAYKKFFDAALKKFKVSSPAELKDDQKKKFYDYIDKNWEGDNEKAEGAMSQVREFKMQSMKAALAQIWGMEEGHNPFAEHKGTKPHKHPHEENEKEVVKDGKTETGKKPATIDLKPKLDDK